MKPHDYAVKYSDKIKLFYDYFRAVLFYKTQPDAGLWHNLSDGWLLVAWGGSNVTFGPSRQEREKMNRETLV